MLDIFDLQGCQLQSQLVAGKIEHEHHEHHELWAPKIGTAWYSNKQIHCDILIYFDKYCLIHFPLHFYTNATQLTWCTSNHQNDLISEQKLSFKKQLFDL
jgi:hypothetical protein